MGTPLGWMCTAINHDQRSSEFSSLTRVPACEVIPLHVVAQSRHNLGGGGGRSPAPGDSVVARRRRKVLRSCSNCSDKTPRPYDSRHNGGRPRRPRRRCAPTYYRSGHKTVRAEATSRAATWDAQKRSSDDLGALIDEADKCLPQWDVIALQEIMTKHRAQRRSYDRQDITTIDSLSSRQGGTSSAKSSAGRARSIRRWHLRGRVALVEFTVGKDATTQQRSRVRAICTHLASLVNHDATELDFWWDEIAQVTGWEERDDACGCQLGTTTTRTDCKTAKDTSATDYNDVDDISKQKTDEYNDVPMTRTTRRFGCATDEQ